MAQTKTSTRSKSSTKKAKTKRAGSTSRPKAKTSGAAKANASRSKSNGSRAKSNGSRSKSSTPTGIQAARETVGEVGAKVEEVGAKAGKATSEAASKAKVPLIAGGAALVGAASGIALKSARSHNAKVLGVKLPKTKVKINSKDLAKAADRVAGAGEQIGRLSTGIRELQGTSETSNGNGHHRSPIEVLVQGLTRRH